MIELRCLKNGFSPRPEPVPGRFVFALLLSSLVVSAYAASFTAALDHDTILLGDTATLSLKFEDAQPGGAPQPPPVAGLQFNYIGPSSQVSFINGETRSSVTHNFQVRPTQPGDYLIPAMSVRIGSETLTTQPIQVKVVRAATPTPGSEAEQEALALLRYALPKQEVFVGETIVIEQQVLIRSGVQNVPALEIPALEISGCAIGKAVQGQQRQTVIGSTPFTVVPFHIPVAVLRAGKLNIGPIDGAVVVELPNRSRQRDPFDPFGMFNRGVQQRVAVSSPLITLDSQPLPEQGKPARFNGAVGQFEMAFSFGPTNVGVGDPVTVRVEIVGRGALDALTLPEQTGWEEFKVYPPTVKTELRDDLGLVGKRSFEQVVVPGSTDIAELPPFEFAYFDPEKRAYQTLHEPARPLLVRPSGATPSPTITANNGPLQRPEIAQDIVHIKPRLGKVVAKSPPLISRPGFVALQTIPLVALLAAVLRRKRADQLANNPRLRRQQQVHRLVHDGLAQLTNLAAEQKSDEFFALVFRLLQEQIGERLDMPASAITEAVIDDRLAGGGLDEESLASLHWLFQQCNQARYAPVQSQQEFEAILPALESALARVNEVCI